MLSKTQPKQPPVILYTTQTAASSTPKMGPSRPQEEHGGCYGS